MAMVALNADRSARVPNGSLEARWMVQEDEVDEYIANARKQPKMQALMRDQAAARLEDEERSKENAELARSWRAALIAERIGGR